MPPPLTRAHLKKTTEMALGKNKRILSTAQYDPPTKKRSVFHDITNAKKTAIPTPENKKKSIKAERPTKHDKDVLYKLGGIKNDVEKSPLELSCELIDISSSSEYLTADTSDSLETEPSLELSETKDDSRMSIEEESSFIEPVPNVTPRIDLPRGVRDFDLDNWRDPYSASCYAQDIFQYLKEREEKFAVKAYLEHQPHITRFMRAVLVDWLVEVQESFELNHEPLYLAVKLVDMFLHLTSGLKKDLLQLVGVTAIFIACKFDERCPPAIDDFLYICDDAYTKKQMITMEKKILQTIKFDLGAPLSYTFQRRYARCASFGLPVLTLARYILETSLMEYEFVVVSDSKLAAASLYLALQMQKTSEWTPQLQYYSGYGEADLLNLARHMNRVLHESDTPETKVIRNKYSHEAFYKVAKIPLLTVEA
uniref:Uncharacterized protein n=1 Tax=Strigamia maritima TaxID=126957 RepID=T1INA5_STRMM